MSSCAYTLHGDEALFTLKFSSFPCNPLGMLGPLYYPLPNSDVDIILSETRQEPQKHCASWGRE